MLNRQFAADVVWGSPYGALVEGFDRFHPIHARFQQKPEILRNANTTAVLKDARANAGTGQTAEPQPGARVGRKPTWRTVTWRRKGLPVFSEIAAPTPLKLMSSKAFPGGAMAQIYRPA